MENRTTSEIEGSIDKLLADLKAVVHDGEALLQAGAENLSEHGVAARERLSAAIDAARETKERLEERAVEGARAADRLVREYPYQSVGIAFGIGLLLGVVLIRK